MRIRNLLTIALAGAALAPGAALGGDRQDCDSPINLRSGAAGTVVNGEVVNCEARLNEITYSPVLPGGTADIFFQGEQPIEGNKFTGFGSYVRYTNSAGQVETFWLTWGPGQGAAGPIAGAWNSQQVSFGARDSIAAGDIYVRVLERIPDPLNPTQCTTPGDLSTCYTVHERTFKTAVNWADGV